MTQVQLLIESISKARADYLSEVNSLSIHQISNKLSDEVWNAIEITEHLYWAEQNGLVAIYKTIHAKEEGKSVWEGDPVNKGLPIEVIIDRTWQTKEIVPASAAPRVGGPIDLWTNYLKSLDVPLHGLVNKLTDEDLGIMTFPHPISGPFDIRQRLEFLRFHIERHRNQVAAVKI
ncbi:DinB family protein [Emticicia sp. C21]|uniref:DinB family protein n=1 Tax=Emticicia sp. C21 TaxID=2302915 RepID=UPI000E345541|nr:DinB family protein [Emticicia sp. C21]RFS13715.1 DinB family protein [Emticicia sp. C21]